MKFVNVRLLVGDIGASIRFWRDVMDFKMSFGDESMGYAYFETDGAGVELMTRQGFTAALGAAAPTDRPAGHQAVLVFRVDDVDAAYAGYVQRGANPLHGPQDRPAWGARAAHLADPDGYLVELYTPLQPQGADAPTS
ncbi:MAG TPA: VOC family protein [Ktedonobacterales bacterium]|nr:VOC family protein [Ktedonobacterales bacterium]